MGKTIKNNKKAVNYLLKRIEDLNAPELSQGLELVDVMFLLRSDPEYQDAIQDYKEMGYTDFEPWPIVKIKGHSWPVIFDPRSEYMAYCGFNGLLDEVVENKKFIKDVNDYFNKYPDFQPNEIKLTIKFDYPDINSSECIVYVGIVTARLCL